MQPTIATDLMTGRRDMAPRTIDLIGVACGQGASDPGCQDGPEVLRALGFIRDLELPGGACLWREVIHVSPAVDGSAVQISLQTVTTVAEALAGQVHDSLMRGNFPLVIGGDHSCAIGTWSGAHAALHTTGGLGLVWIDAHMDSHTFLTSPSNALHGMPLACLLGYGDAGLRSIGGGCVKLRPEDVCLIGVRSFEWGEAALLKNLGVRVYFMDEVRSRGLAQVFQEAWERVGRYTTSSGISLDLDALDPVEEPGVGTPEPGGLHRADVVDVLRSVRGDARLRVLEIVEYNPYADRGFATAHAIHDFCQAIIP